MVLALVAVALWIPACGSDRPTFSNAEVVQLYTAALDTLRLEFESGDSLAIHPLPRMLDEDDAGTARMADYNEYGDPALTTALMSGPRFVRCRTESGGGCDRAIYPSFVEVSELLPVSAREAVVLAFHSGTRDRRVPARQVYAHLRFGDGRWRVSRIGPAEQGIHAR